MLASKASVYKGSVEQELEHYKNRNTILDLILLEEKCLTHTSNIRSARALVYDGKLAKTQLEVEIKYYQELTSLLVTCREGSTSKSTLTTQSSGKTTESVTTTTTTLSAIETTIAIGTAATTTKSIEGGTVNLALGKG